MVKKKVTKKDPHFAREAEKYENPIASREFILDHLQKRQGPATLPELAQELSLTDDTSYEALRRRLIAMTRDGQLACNRRGAYGVISKMNLVRGRVQGHRDGYGFLIAEDGKGDIYLHARQMRTVFDGDIAVVRLDGLDEKGRREGVIVEVLERNTHMLVGRFFEEEGVAFVVPDNRRLNQDILIAPERKQNARHGQYVVVEILQQPTFRTKAIGQITEVLGDHLAPGMEIDVAIRSHGIPFVWPQELEQEVAGLSNEVKEADKKARVDIRHLPLVTIDGEDAKDFDDAVYCEVKKGGGWRLYVAIADVSHYVRPGTALDNEAVQRGNSVYFPDYVIPMLPEILSNGLCSLNPDVDRLCMVCEMTVSAQGRVSGYKFYEGVMRSHARLTYTKVATMMQDAGSKEGQRLREDYRPLVPALENLYELYHALREERERRGAIDFDTVETRIIFGENRKIDEIVPVIRNDAHRLIEECMLCANVCAARLLEKYNVIGLYRVHEGPTTEKLENLRSFLGELGLNLRGGDKPTPDDYQRLLQEVAERPDATLIQTMMLRSLSQAVYTPDNQGHFGLNYKSYTHFTSPIRRYPDLLVHRAIKSLIRGEGDVPNVVRVKGAAPVPKHERYQYDMGRMLAMGEHCSMTERRADEATRDVASWLKCEYLQQHLGSDFDGVVSAVVPFGLFVELKDLYVEGLVHVSSLNSDYYNYDAARQRLVGERTGTSYRLGDTVRVKVVRIDLADRKIDFELIGQPARQRKSKSGGKGDGKGKRDGTFVPDADTKPSKQDKKTARRATKQELREAILGKPGGGKAPGAGKKTRRRSGKKR